MDAISVLKEKKVVAVVRADSKEKAVKIVEACIQGGMDIIEITYTIPDAGQVLDYLHKKYGDTIFLGAGTVLNEDTAKDAIEHGARFIVSPGFDDQTARYCKHVEIDYIPGCMTITEMLQAKKAGANMIKLFPGSAFKPSFIKSVKGPLPDIDIMPTGGINTENIKQWFTSGASAVGIGSALTKPAIHDDYESIKKIAKEFIKLTKEVN